MATIKQLSTGKEYILYPGFLVGRSHKASLRLENRLVSGEHASFRWTGAMWEISDLGSRNGTYVNGKRLESGAHCALLTGFKLAFGDTDDVFELMDDALPEPMASVGDGEMVFGDCGVLALPSSDDPQLMIHATDSGGWVAEDPDGECRPVKTGHTVECAGQTFHLTLPESWQPTWQADEPEVRVDGLALRFVDHGHDSLPSVAVVHGGKETALRPRVHHRLLLELARQRLEDLVDPHLKASSHGWIEVEELCKYLGEISQYQLNLHVCRAREQLRSAGVMDPHKLFERRQNTADESNKRQRQIRIGIADLEIR